MRVKAVRNAILATCLVGGVGTGNAAWAQTTWYVDADSTDPTHDGSNWCDAFTTLQDALVAASASDTILVANGTYTPDQGGGQTPGDRSATFQLITGVTIEGGYAGCGAPDPNERNSGAHETILGGDLSGNDTPVACSQDSPDCDSFGGLCVDGSCIVHQNNGENSYHVLNGTGTDASALLEGFVVTAGNADGTPPDNDGGAMVINPGSPRVRDCIFQANHASTVADFGSAGAVIVDGASSPQLSGCVFIGNVATSGTGGAVSLSGSGNTEIVNCRFLGNHASNGGAARLGSSATFVNCLFSGNSDALGGGAIRTFWGNDDVLFANCTFHANTSNGNGGALWMSEVSGPPVEIDNCVFWQNVDSGGADESAQIHVASGGPPVVNYTLIQGLTGGLGGVGNVDGDPMFVDADGPDSIVGTEDDDLQPRSGSPVIDAGDNDALPPDGTDLDDDFDIVELLPFDLGGKTRRIDDTTIIDTGNAGIAGTPVVDIGAYEFEPPIYVDAAAGGTPDGTSWTDAYTTLQDALDDAAITPRDIWVVAGTYEPDQGGGEVPGNRSATFQLIDDVAIYGGFAGGESALVDRDVAANETVLTGDLDGDDTPAACTQDSPDCDSLGGRCIEGSCIVKQNNTENSYHVVTGSGADATAVLDGFTITAGNADGTSHDSQGGGLFNDSGSPTVINCTLSRNSAGQDGGGMLNIGNSSPTVTNCTFSRNSVGQDGGGMFNNLSSPTVTNCTFSENFSESLGGGILNNSGSSATLIHCTFSGNTATNFGGGMMNVNSDPTVTNCTFNGNSAFQGGGGMYNVSTSDPTVTNCTFSGNSATIQGGGMFNTNDSRPTITNCTFSENSANIQGGGLFNTGANTNPTLNNCIFWNNSDGGGMDESAQIHTSSGTPTVDYSIIQGGWTGAGGTGIVTTDPLFIDPDGPDSIPGTEDDNLRLRVGSPGIDSGDNDALPADDFDLDGDLDTSEELPIDLEGNDRRIDDTTVVDTGNAGSVGAPVVDMGAYELQPPIFVDASAIAGAADGTSWTDAYTTLQDALDDAATTPRDIWVVAGTYKPDQGGGETPGDRSATFQLINGVAIYGGFAGGETTFDQRDVDANETILSGDLVGDDAPVACSVDSPDCDSFGGRCVDGFCIVKQNNTENSYHVVTGSAADATAVLDGFTITGGNADGVFPDNNGGGMYNDAGSPTVTNCTFSGNSAINGGGMYNEDSSSPTLTDCTFSGNSASVDGGGMLNFESGPMLTNCSFTGNSANDGGAVYNLTNSSPTLTDCTFAGNSANDGGAMYNLTNSSPTLIDCTFTGNTTTEIGAGMFNDGNSNPQLTNCVFDGNSASDIAGGMYNGTSDPNLTNCVFDGNTGLQGGGMYNQSANPTVTNCTFSGNSAGTDGGGMWNSIGSPTVTNCIFWGNSDAGGNDESGQIHTDSGTPVVNYSIVQAGWTGAGGTGNSASDPLFIDADGVDDLPGTDDDDLRIRIGSPAVDAGDNDALPTDDFDLDGDLDTSEELPIDLDGNDRRIDDTTVVDTGNAGSVGTPVVDMGAYEFEPPIFVDAGAGGAADGTSWADAYTTVQDALADAAVSSLDIWVAGGIYEPDQGGGETPGDRSATFQLLNGVALYGGFAGTETALIDRDILSNQTVLGGDLDGDDADVSCTQDSPDCDSYGGRCIDGLCIIKQNNGENTYHVVTGSGTDPTAVLDGFTITGANADGANPDDRGAGMHNDAGSPTLTNCTFSGNSAGVDGGGMFNENISSPTVTNCTFSGNSALFGGGMRNHQSSSPRLMNCTFNGNSALSGGGVFNVISSPTLTNCTFLSNSGSIEGGAVRNDSSDPAMTNCTFSANNASSGGGIFNRLNSNPTLTNCILWANSDAGGMDESAQIHTDSGTPVVTYSCIQDDDPNDLNVFPGTGNIDDNPRFADPFSLDLRPRFGSPVVDAGDNDALPADEHDIDGDGDTAESIPLDLDGRRRRLDDPSVVPDPGNAGALGPPVVDMGAYELAPPIFVDAGASGTADGTSWADAFTKLQDALRMAAGMAVSPEIWIAAGTYTPDAQSCTVDDDCNGFGARTCPSGECVWTLPRRQSLQLSSGVALYGGFSGVESSRNDRNIVLNETVLSGDRDGNDLPVPCTLDTPDCDSFGGLCLDGFCIIKDNNSQNSYHVVRGTGAGSTAVLDGFTITGGNANEAGFEWGGGLLAGYVGDGGSVTEPTILNCLFTGNAAAFYGGGMYNAGNPLNSPTLRDCTFRGNASGGGSGGLAYAAGSGEVTRCTFVGNSADSSGGGLSLGTGAVTVTSSAFYSNVSGAGGGGLSISNGTNAITNCLFSGNSAIGGGAALISGSGAWATFTNCSFTGNSASVDGGGLHENTGNSNTRIRNCILWGNSDSGGMDESAQFFVFAGTPAVDYSVVQGGWTGGGGTGIVTGDPLFVDADGADNIPGTEDDDLRLSDGSPAIDAANTAALPADTADLDDDGDTTESIPLDLDGNPRALDDLLTPDTGVPGAPVVEMGAYEFFRDCNDSGAPDSVEIASGTSQDCNSTDIPDECDIADCTSGDPGYPGCDDCNLNEVPDSCDIAGATSQDVNLDQVPDECKEWTGTSGNFSDGLNWQDGNPPGSDDHGTIGQAGGTRDEAYAGLAIVVTVDQDATVGTLRLLGGATLNVTEAAQGNLTVAGEGGLVNEGNMFVAHDRAIDVSTGTVTIGKGGTYIADPNAVGTVSASLSAASLAISAPDCSTFTGGGQLRLDEQMSATVSGNLTIRGGDSLTCGGVLLPPGDAQSSQQVVAVRTCSSELATASSAPGVIVPPKLSSCGSTTPRTTANAAVSGVMLTIIGDLTLSGAVLSINEANAAIDEGVTIGGDFNNRSAFPSLFNWSQGRVVLDGTDTQTFEVGGFDFGQTAEGFLTDRDTPVDTDQHTNFSVGVLEVAQGGSVRFTNQYANTAGEGACSEALYVHDLQLGDDTTVTIDNCKVYYQNWTLAETATLAMIGCGELVCLQVADPPAVSGFTKNRFLSIEVGNADHLTAARVKFAALPSPFSSFDGRTFWVGEPVQVCENAGQGFNVNPRFDICGPAPGVYASGRDWFWAAPISCDPLSAYWMDWTTLDRYCNAPSQASNAEPCDDACAPGGGTCDTETDLCSGGNNDGQPCCPGGACGVDTAVHIYHWGIVPSHMLSGAGPIDVAAEYHIQAVDSTCLITSEKSFSDPLSTAQAGWGDVVLNVAECPNGAPDESVGVVTDVISLLNKFSNLPCAIQKSRADLVPCRVDFSIGITDVVAALSAFTGGDHEDVCGSGQCGPLGLCKGGPDHNTPCTNDDDCSSDPCG